MREVTLLSLSLVAVVSIAGCSQPEVCQPGQARGLGKAQALRGEPMDTTIGGRCSESASDVQTGYQEGLAELCNPEAARREGWNAGQYGQGTYGLPQRFQKCTNTPQLQAGFNAGYQQGMQRFCGSVGAGAYQAGIAQGTYGMPAVPQQLPPACASQQAQADSEYKRGHKDGLARFCSTEVAQARGTEDGHWGRPPVDTSRMFGACDAALAKKLQKDYLAAHKAGLGFFCANDRILSTAQAAARDGAESSSLPQEFSVCPAATAAAYDAAFAKEHDKYMAKNCNYEKGTQVGRQHANKYSDKKLSMPSFCTKELFADYQKGYNAGWKDAKGALCSEADATNRGMADAQGGWPQSYQAPSLCPANTHNKLLAAYRQGYASVQKPPPTVVVVEAPPPPPESSGEISWNTDATKWRGKLGQRLSFSCPPGKPQKIWGTDVYSDDSSLCSAAVHAGVISKKGGPITIEIRAGLPSYRGSKRHKISSWENGPWDGSFVVLGATGGDDDEGEPAYVNPNESAYAACMNAGYAPSSCNGVTSATCIRKGYSPNSCKLPRQFLLAINTCLDSGYAPTSCKDVTVAMCIRKGYGPSSCQLPTQHLDAVEACLEAGYSPTSCKDVISAKCIKRGNIPSNCMRGDNSQVAHQQPPPGPPPSHGDDDDDDDKYDAQGLYQRCVTWADGEYKRAMMPVDARDKANANCKGIKDLDIAGYVFEQAKRGAMPQDAMDLALDEGKRNMRRKLEVLKYAVDKYSKSMMPVDAIKRGLSKIERVPRKALSCVQSNYDAYARGAMPQDAMDKALDACKK
jgi:hypothetical protein